MDELTYLIAAKLQADLRSKANTASSGLPPGSAIKGRSASQQQIVRDRTPTTTSQWRLVQLR